MLTSKGGVEKEIYALKRLAAAAEDDEAAAKGALRFDLTVPLARYVAMTSEAGISVPALPDRVGVARANAASEERPLPRV